MTENSVRRWRPQLRLSTLLLLVALVAMWAAQHRDRAELKQERKVLLQRCEELSRNVAKLRRDYGEQTFTIAKLRSLNAELTQNLMSRENSATTEQH